MRLENLVDFDLDFDEILTKLYTLFFLIPLMKVAEDDHNNKGRFCNTIASVALIHTSIQSD